MTTATTPDKIPLRAWLPNFVVLGAIWGSSFLFIKIGVRELHPLYVTLGRVTAGALTLLVVLAVIRDRLPRDLRLWLHLTVVAALGVALPFTLFGYGEQRVSSMLGGIWNATTPLIALPLSVLLFRTERMTARRAVGLGLGFVGVLVVLGVWQGVGGAHFTGQMLCFAAAFCYGIAIPYQKRFITGRSESGVSLAAAQLIMAVALLAIVAPLVAGAPPAPTTLSLDVIASVLALGAIGTGIAIAMNLHNIRLIGASSAAAVTYLIPVFAVLIGVLVLNENLVWHQPVGALIVLFGVAVSQGLFNGRTAKRSHPAAAVTDGPVTSVSSGAPASPAGSAATPTGAAVSRSG